MTYWLVSHVVSIILAVCPFLEYFLLFESSFVLPSSYVCALGLGLCQYSHLIYLYIYICICIFLNSGVDEVVGTED